MTITHLHALARLELQALAQARYMPAGYSREASQKIDRSLYELGRYLDAVLAAQPDKLMRRPDRHALQALLQRAAGERTKRNMVERMVEYLLALPDIDQAHAYGLTQLAEQRHSAELMTRHLTELTRLLDEREDHCVRLGVSSQPLRQAIADLQADVTDCDLKAARQQQVLDHCT